MRIVIYVILLFGTFMVTFFGRCAVAQVLKQMPWNRGREVRLNQVASRRTAKYQNRTGRVLTTGEHVAPGADGLDHVLAKGQDPGGAFQVGVQQQPQT